MSRVRCCHRARRWNLWASLGVDIGFAWVGPSASEGEMASFDGWLRVAASSLIHSTMSPKARFTICTPQQESTSRVLSQFPAD